MCHQTVGLVQGEIERAGIITVSITLLPEITRKVRPPRALEVPFPLGFPLGIPPQVESDSSAESMPTGDAEGQRRVLVRMLEMCQDGGVGCPNGTEELDPVPRVEQLV
jgi:hypothetical protein